MPRLHMRRVRLHLIRVYLHLLLHQKLQAALLSKQRFNIIHKPHQHSSRLALENLQIQEKVLRQKLEDDHQNQVLHQNTKQNQEKITLSQIQV